MFEFDPFYLLLWIFLGFFVPGALLSISLLKKKELPLFDKAGIGFGLGLVLPAFFAFVFFIAGISFSYSIAVLSVALFYLVAITFFIKEKAWEGISLPADYNKLAPSIALALIMLLAFWVRMVTYGPVFMELDPYFYIQHTTYILSEGGAPLWDGSAWYPQETSHRVAPMKAYLEAITYGLYNHDTVFDRYMLSAVAGMLPPIFAALAVFFLYLFVSSEYSRTFALVSAGVAAFTPMFMMKLMAGESEIQPYAFFGLAFFLGTYALAAKRKDLLFAVLAGIAFFATLLGSSSAVVLVATLLIFMPLQAIFLFFMKEDLLEHVKINGIILLLGPILSTVANNLFHEKFFFEGMLSGYTPVLLTAYLFSLAILALQAMSGASALKLPVREYLEVTKSDLRKAAPVIAGVVLSALILVFFTPIGDPIFSMGERVLGIAEFNNPLDRTIAEQGVAGASFQSELGFIGMDFTKLPDMDQLLDFSNKNIVFGLFDLVVGILQHLFAFAAVFLTGISNLLLGAMVEILNAIFGTELQYKDKNNSMLMVIFFGMFAAVFHSIYIKFKKKEQRLALLFAAFIFPISLIGLFKTKYVIYLGFALAAGLGVALGEASQFLGNLINNMKDREKSKVYSNYLMLGFTLISFFFVYFEWDTGNADTLFFSSFQPRFQDNPDALQPKMQELCTISNYGPACSAAEDPVGFASRGMVSQYDQMLCIYSLYSDPINPTPEEQFASSMRCNMLTSYWIEFTEWQFEESPEDARFTSWWDYGHWTNYFGQRNTVLRNDHSNQGMIVEVAHGFIYGTPQELKQVMQEYGSEYVFFDREIIYNSDGSFGGKFHALNYLSCSRNNETSVAHSPGQSTCEAAHRWEQIAVPAAQQPCTISTLSGKTGVTAYNAISGQPTYCMGETTLSTGETIAVPYKLDEKYENGDLKLHKGFLKQIGTSQDGTIIFDMYYTKDPVWVENGEIKSGWEDRTTQFYDSTLYQAFVLESLEGFTPVHKTSDGAVKTYRISG
jgi:hypothetical protein